jgi:hypothetical protein
LDDEEIRTMLRQHWEHASRDDHEAGHAMYHDDAILEWPQSGERFVGREALQAMRQQAPPLDFKTWRVSGSGSYWVAENLMSVDGSDPVFTVNVLEFRGGKVAREVVYITEPFEAAPERSQWAERFDPRREDA